MLRFLVLYAKRNVIERQPLLHSKIVTITIATTTAYYKMFEVPLINSPIAIDIENATAAAKIVISITATGNDIIIISRSISVIPTATNDIQMSLFATAISLTPPVNEVILSVWRRYI